jgi:hypothetical protein
MYLPESTVKIGWRWETTGACGRVGEGGPKRVADAGVEKPGVGAGEERHLAIHMEIGGIEDMKTNANGGLKREKPRTFCRLQS